jgi:hypothetical protein
MISVSIAYNKNNFINFKFPFRVRGMKQVLQITAEQAAAFVKDGDTIFGGGFGMTGTRFTCCMRLLKQRLKI